ncbi:hypothetical protein R1sor_011341 [Riccia sorocarpa]|uniref:Uncharacterized protein n=1 Tax=Riccia sorocarpa TaxID=122646 RepID=A0ABD3I4I3_9MARC
MEAEIQEREEIFVREAVASKLANFVLLIDVAAGLMLILRPSDDFVCQDCLWVVKALGSVCTDAEDRNINKIPIQWWRPKHASSKASDEDRYAQCGASTEQEDTTRCRRSRSSHADDAKPRSRRSRRSSPDADRDRRPQPVPLVELELDEYGIPEGDSLRVLGTMVREVCRLYMPDDAIWSAVPVNQ